MLTDLTLTIEEAVFPPRPKERGFHTEYFDEPPSTIILYKCGCSSAVERQLPKLRVTGSIPVTRLNIDLKSRKLRKIMARNERLTKEEIQEDKFIEGILKTYTLLRKNLRTIVIIVGVILVAVAGYAAYYQNQETRRAEATVAFRQATEAYQTAEESIFDTEKLAESEESLKTAQTQLQEVFDKHPDTTFSDKARYQYAKTLYYQQSYPEARALFQQVIDQHQPENQIYSLYAQKAIGNTYEQEGNYEKAIAAYQTKEFPPTPQLSPEIRKFVLASAKFNQALAYEKSGDPDAARAAYKEIIDEFRITLEAGLAQKSRKLIEEAKVVITTIGEP